MTETDVILKYKSLVHKTAFRLANMGPLQDDLVSVGYEAIIEAWRKYDPKKAAFSTIATVRIKGAMLDEIRRWNGTRRKRGIVEFTRTELDDFAETRYRAPSDVSCLIAGQCVALLKDERRRVVLLHYWQELSYQAIGKVIGKSAMTAFNIHAEAIGEIKRSMNMYTKVDR